MNRVQDFIEKYLALYLTDCRIKNPFIETEHTFPPTSKELEELIFYLTNNNIGPVIIGSIAVIRHLQLTVEDIKAHRYRPTHQLELFVSQKLPDPPPEWQNSKNSVEAVSWISPTGGVVDFFTIEELFPQDASNPVVGKDPESVRMGCPVADLQTLFIIKLNSDRERDLLDVLLLARKWGFSKSLEKHLWSSTQRRNLEIARLWIKKRGDH